MLYKRTFLSRTSGQAFFIVALGCLMGWVPESNAQVVEMNRVVSLKEGLQEMLQGNGAKSLKRLTVNVDADKSKELRQKGVSAEGSYTVYQGIGAEDMLVGLVFVINERGKEGPLQVLVAINPAGQIYDLGFTVFGEDKGKTAMRPSYLSQFIEKSAVDAFALGDDIDGVSGATWTSESVTTAVHRAVVLYDMFF